jgi:hypothetical protein
MALDDVRLVTSVVGALKHDATVQQMTAMLRGLAMREQQRSQQLASCDVGLAASNGAGGFRPLLPMFAATAGGSTGQALLNGSDSPRLFQPSGGFSPMMQPSTTTTITPSGAGCSSTVGVFGGGTTSYSAVQQPAPAWVSSPAVHQLDRGDDPELPRGKRRRGEGGAAATSLQPPELHQGGNWSLDTGFSGNPLGDGPTNAAAAVHLEPVRIKDADLHPDDAVLLQGCVGYPTCNPTCNTPLAVSLTHPNIPLSHSLHHRHTRHLIIGRVFSLFLRCCALKTYAGLAG